jgi:butyryl-CoA dehydrogenase
MPEQLLCPRNLSFELYEVHEAQALLRRERFAMHSRQTFDEATGKARCIAAEFFAPHYRQTDEQEPQIVDGSAVLLPEVHLAVDAFIEAGFLTATGDLAQGGMQLPHLITQACFAHFQSANVGTANYPFLAIGVARLIDSFGSPEQKRLFLQPLLEGRFFGTMGMTEPDAGSALTDLCTSASPQADGSYRIQGCKTFISAGDHTLGENILHMVLARLPDAPAGARGISLFIVPKFMVNADGSLGPRNGVTLRALLHKMGWRGSTTATLGFGDDAPCIGYLLGQPNQGLSYMFQMMNAARISTGMGATMLGYAGFLYALNYARKRIQGRPLDARDPVGARVPIIEHADVRRLLIAQKAYVEGAFDLLLYGARLLDDSQTLDGEQRQNAQQLLDLLTPVIKSWPSEYCLKANEMAIQVLGGYGYTRAHPVEQHYRDNRVNAIHEGTNGIQALDLLSRKIGQHGSAAFSQLMNLIDDTCRRSEPFASLQSLRTALQQVQQHLQRVSAGLLGDLALGHAQQSLANAALYLKVFGHLVIGWRWLEQAIRAEQGLVRGEQADIDFYLGKLRAARYFITWELPPCLHELNLLECRDDTCLSAQSGWL